MTPLRQKMIKAMELRNLAKNTQRYYLSAVIGLARHYRQSPDTLTQEMIEDYEEYLIETGELSDYQERMIQVSSNMFGRGRGGAH